MASLIQRNGKYYLQWYVGKTIRRRSLKTDSLQVAKEHLRQFESAQARGFDNPLPTRTPIGEILDAYVSHIRTVKAAKSAQTDIYYLRQVFGTACPALEVTSRKLTPKRWKRPPKPGQDRRFKAPTIEVTYFEQVTTADLSTWLQSHVASRGLAPKTANRYREILTRLYNWAIKEGRVQMPGDRNPAAAITRHKETAPVISFLTLEQIDRQLSALKDHPQFQAMVALYIYAGLRREEALWLTISDIDLKSGPFGIIRVRAKTIKGEFWQPKTKINRAVPISRALRGYLNTWRPRITPERWCFPSPQGKRYDPDNFASDLARVQQQAGLKWTCLDFRHTFGSQLAQKGESLFKISTLMGNSPEICRRHYAALVPEALHTTVEFLPPQSVGKDPYTQTQPSERYKQAISS